MPKSLLVFAVYPTPETPNLGHSVESRTPLVEFFNFSKFLLFNCVYAHISNLNYKNILILKKIEFGYFRVWKPLKICYNINYLSYTLSNARPILFSQQT